MKRSLADYFERLRSYEPESDIRKPLRFAHVARFYPVPSALTSFRLPRVGMADFAVIGYCAYTAWHRAKGTEERRLTRVAKALERGTRSHEGRLVVTEIKTGKYALMPDHFLQTWGYCLSAPSALLRVTSGDFRARD